MQLKGFNLVLVRLIIVFIPLYLVYFYISGIMAPVDVAVAHGEPAEYPSALMRSWNGATTAGVSWLMDISGVENSYADNYLVFFSGDQEISMYVGWQCNFLLPFLSYIAMVVALLGIDWRDRVIGIAGGLLAIYIGNLLRITLLGIAGSRWGYAAMDRCHSLLFNNFLALWTALIFLAWVWWMGGIRTLRKGFGIEEGGG